MSTKADRRFYNSAAWRNLRRQLLWERGYRCESCGVRMRSNGLILHHIESRSYRPDLAMDPNNLTIACYRCHRSQHRPPARRQRPDPRTEFKTRIYQNLKESTNDTETESRV